MDATQFLESQHRMVEELFEQIENTDDEDAKMELFEELADALAAHATIEEELFYPACMTQELQDTLLEAVEEHLSAKRVIADLLKLEIDDDRFDAKVSVLCDLITHHVEEEENELFPKVRRAIGSAELNALGAQLEQRFAELMFGGAPPRQAVPQETREAAPLPPP